MAKIFKDIWDKSKDGSKKEERGFVRFLIIATAIFLVVLLVKRDNVIRWVQTAFELRRQKREIEYYQEEIKRLDSEIEGFPIIVTASKLMPASNSTLPSRGMMFIYWNNSLPMAPLHRNCPEATWALCARTPK